MWVGGSARRMEDIRQFGSLFDKEIVGKCLKGSKGIEGNFPDRRLVFADLVESCISRPLVEV